MSLFIRKLFIFCVFFFLFEKSSYWVLDFSSRYEYDRRLEYVLEGKINKDLIVLGSSRGGGNILAKQLSVETGLESYNLSYPGSDIIFHEFVFNTFVKHNKHPKAIVYLVDNPTVFSKDESLSFRNDRLYPVSYNGDVNDMLIKNDVHGFLSKYLYSMRLRRFNFSFKSKTKPKDRMLTDYGSTVFPYYNEDRSWVASIKNGPPIFKKELIENLKLEAFKRIVNKCNEENVQLIFAFAPNYKAMNYNFIKYFKTHMKNENICFIYNQNDRRYKDSTFFYDQAHLNVEGAKIFTSEISTFINSKKDILNNENSPNNRN